MSLWPGLDISSRTDSDAAQRGGEVDGSMDALCVLAHSFSAQVIFLPEQTPVNEMVAAYVAILSA